MAGLFDALAGEAPVEGDLLQLSDKERSEFDEITYDKIQAMTDMKKLARLEAYMRREEFCSTAEVARKRLQSLGSSAAKQEAPVLPARRDADDELDQVLKELKSWEASVKGADKALKEDSVPSEPDAAPIRRHVGGKVDKAGLIEEPEKQKPKNAKEVVEKAKRMKDPKDVRSGADYYKKWDKVAENLEKEVNPSSEAAEPTKENSEKEPQEDTDKSDTATLSAAAADRLVEAAWKKPAVEREWLANREREKGNELFKSQEYRSSIVAYTLTIRLMPTSAAAYSNRAAAYLKLKQYKEAEADCTKALEIAPLYKKALHRRATARMELENYGGAITNLESALRLDPESKEIANLLQKARTKVGKKTGGDEKPMKRMQIEEVEEEEGPSDSDGQAADSKAAGDVRRGGSETEVEHASRSAGRKGDEGDAVREEGPKGQRPVLEVKGTQSTDLDRLQRGGSAGAEQSNAHQSNGTAVDQKQPDAEAQKEADGAKLAEEWREKGNLLFKRGDTTGAEACYTHSLTYSKTAAALSNRAMCRNKVGKYREAEDDASAAIEADSTYVKAYHRRAAARRGQNKKEQAMEDYKVVLQAMPTNSALQEEVRSLQKELEESMYIPPRKAGAPVIEEVEDEKLSPRPTPAPLASNPAKPHGKPSIDTAQKLPPSTGKPSEQLVKESSTGAQPSPRKAHRIPRPDRNGSGGEKQGAREGGEKGASSDKPREVHTEGRNVDSTSKASPRKREAASATESTAGVSGEDGERTNGKPEMETDAHKVGASPSEGGSPSGSKAPTSVEQASVSEADRKQEAEREKEEGNRLFKQRDVSGAIKHYSRAIELQPSNAAFYGNRAMCYLQLKNYEGVVRDTTRALELDPEYSKAYYRRALARKGLGQYEGALEDLRFVQEKLPKDKRVGLRTWQVTEEVLSITNLYMRRFENLASAPAKPATKPVAEPSSKVDPSETQAQPPKFRESTDSQAGAIGLKSTPEPGKKVLPAWLKEQLAEQVKQGGLRASPEPSPPGVGPSGPSIAENGTSTQTERGVPVRKVGSLTDEVFQSKPSLFESNQDRPAFSLGSFDKNAASPKTSPRAGKKRASPRAVVSTAAEVKTPPSEKEDEKTPRVPIAPTEKMPKVAGNGERTRVSSVTEAVKKVDALPSTAGAERGDNGSKPLPDKPRSALEFERACASLREPERIAEYLQTLDSSSYPSIIKENLSAVLMTHIANALPLLPAKPAADVMTGLASVSRFKLTWMLLPPATKKMYSASLDRIRLEGGHPETVEKLKKAYPA